MSAMKTIDAKVSSQCLSDALEGCACHNILENESEEENDVSKGITVTNAFCVPQKTGKTLTEGSLATFV